LTIKDEEVAAGPVNDFFQNDMLRGASRTLKINGSILKNFSLI
jgi:hypothetical protein